jgi:hypothetical protein
MRSTSPQLTSITGIQMVGVMSDEEGGDKNVKVHLAQLVVERDLSANFGKIQRVLAGVGRKTFKPVQWFNDNTRRGGGTGEPDPTPWQNPAADPPSPKRLRRDRGRGGQKGKI